MANKAESAGNLLVIEFDNHITPVVRKNTNKPWLLWGENNDYPNYLLELYKRDACNGAIIKAKADHVYGLGLCYDADKMNLIEAAQYEAFLGRANRFEDWNSIFRKNVTPFEIFDGVALQIIYGIGGKITDVFNLEFSKFRRSPCGKFVFYCDRWINEDGSPNHSADRHASYKKYPIFNPSIRVGTQILYYKTEVMSAFEYGNIYPEPNYIQSCQDIETNIEITNFHYSNMKNGMFAAAMLSLFNGEPSEQDKKQYERLFNRKFKGTGNTGKMMFNFVDKGGQKAELTTLTQSDLDKMFEMAGHRAQQNIFTGHRTDPVLAGIFDGQVVIGDNTQYLQKFDRWQKSYIQHRQQIHLEIIKTIAEVNGVCLDHLEVKQKQPANVDLPYDANFLLNLFDAPTLRTAYAKQLGIEIPKEEPGQNAPLVPEQHINEHLKNLTGKQWINIKRMIREVANGKTTKEVAAMMLKNSYGLSDHDISILFTTPQDNFSRFDKVVDMTTYVLELFEANAIDEDDGEILSEEFVSFKNSAEAFNHEFSKHRKFDDSLQGKILEILKGAPTTTVDQIAKQLGTDKETVQAYIDKLILLGLITTATAAGLLTVTDKGLNTPTPTVQTEIYTVYKYVTRPDVPSVETTSRPFCKKMLAMTRNGKVWTRDAIDNMTNVFDEDPWTYRGGFYTNPDTGETTPYCRHVWKSITKARKKK